MDLRYDINRTRPRRGHKYTKYKMYFSMMMVTCNKQHLSNIWRWIHGKEKQDWGWVEKKKLLMKKACIFELKVTLVIYYGNNLLWKFGLTSKITLYEFQ